MELLQPKISSKNCVPDPVGGSLENGGMWKFSIRILLLPLKAYHIKWAYQYLQNCDLSPNNSGFFSKYQRAFKGETGDGNSKNGSRDNNWQYMYIGL